LAGGLAERESEEERRGRLTLQKYDIPPLRQLVKKYLMVDFAGALRKIRPFVKVSNSRCHSHHEGYSSDVTSFTPQVSFRLNPGEFARKLSLLQNEGKKKTKTKQRIKERA